MIRPPFRLAEVLLEPDDAITAVDKSFQPIDAPGHGEHAEPLVAQLATEGLTDPRRCPRDHGQWRRHAHRLPRGREPTATLEHDGDRRTVRRDARRPCWPRSCSGTVPSILCGTRVRRTVVDAFPSSCFRAPRGHGRSVAEAVIPPPLGRCGRRLVRPCCLTCRRKMWRRSRGWCCSCCECVECATDAAATSPAPAFGALIPPA